MTYSLDFTILSTMPVEERIPDLWQAFHKAVDDIIKQGHYFDTALLAVPTQAKIAEGQVHIKQLADDGDKQTAEQFLHRVSDMLGEQLDTIKRLQKVFPAGKVCESIRRFMAELCSMHNIQVWQQRRLASKVLH